MAYKLKPSEIRKNNLTPTERWKHHPEFKEYEISDEGRVRRYFEEGDYYSYLNPKKQKNGFVTVQIYKSPRMLSRLVYEAFYGPIPKGYCIGYKNGCRGFCDLYNLELVKYRDAHAGHKNKTKKVVDLKHKRVYLNAFTASQILNLHPSTVYKHLHGETKTKRFIYYEDYKQARSAMS